MTLFDPKRKRKKRKEKKKSCDQHKTTKTNKKDSFVKAQHWMNEIKNEPSRPLVYLVGLKSDLEEKRQVSHQLASDFAQIHNINGFLEVSPKTLHNVSRLFVEIGNALTASPQSQSYPSNTTSSFVAP